MMESRTHFGGIMMSIRIGKRDSRGGFVNQNETHNRGVHEAVEKIVVSFYVTNLSQDIQPREL